MCALVRFRVFLHVQSDDQHKAIINSNAVTNVERRSHFELTKESRVMVTTYFMLNPCLPMIIPRHQSFYIKMASIMMQLFPPEKHYDQKCLQDTNHIKGVILNTYAGTHLSYSYDGIAWCNHRKNATNFSQNRNEMTHPQSKLFIMKLGVFLCTYRSKPITTGHAWKAVL